MQDDAAHRWKTAKRTHHWPLDSGWEKMMHDSSIEINCRVVITVANSRGPNVRMVCTMHSCPARMRPTQTSAQALGCQAASETTIFERWEPAVDAAESVRMEAKDSGCLRTNASAALSCPQLTSPASRQVGQCSVHTAGCFRQHKAVWSAPKRLRPAEKRVVYRIWL